MTLAASFGDYRRAQINNSRTEKKYDILRASLVRAALLRIYRDRKDDVDAIKVSIVLPTYNRRDQICRAIRSVFEQTHAGWELILVDDGSTDDTEQVIEPFLNDRRVKYLKKINGGVSSARNLGLTAATGQYIFYLDSDNYWQVDHLRFMIAFMEECSLSSAYCALEYRNSENKALFYMGTDFLWQECSFLNYVDMNCFAHTAKAAKDIYFDEALARLVDWDFILAVTKANRTAFLPYLGVTYYGDDRPDRLTLSQYNGGELPGIINRIRQRHRTGNPEDIAKLHPLPEEIDRLLGIKRPLPV